MSWKHYLHSVKSAPFSIKVLAFIYLWGFIPFFLGAIFCLLALPFSFSRETIEDIPSIFLSAILFAMVALPFWFCLFQVFSEKRSAYRLQLFCAIPFIIVGLICAVTAITWDFYFQCARFKTTAFRRLALA